MDRVPSDSGPNRRRSALSDLPGCPVGKTARPSSSQLARVHGFVYTMPWVFRLRLVRCQARRWCAGMGAPLYDDGSFNSCGAALSLNIHKLNREPCWEQYRRAHCGPSQKSGARKRLVRQTRPRCVPERQTIRRSRSSRRTPGAETGTGEGPLCHLTHTFGTQVPDWHAARAGGGGVGWTRFRRRFAGASAGTAGQRRGTGTQSMSGAGGGRSAARDAVSRWANQPIPCGRHPQIQRWPLLGLGGWRGPAGGRSH